MHKHLVKGCITEMRFVIQATEHDWRVSQPIFKDGQYDFLIEKSGKVLKIQVKKGHYNKAGSLRASLLYSTRHKPLKKYVAEKVDFFAVYDERQQVFFIIPFSEVSDFVSVTIFKGSPLYKYIDNWDFKEVV